MLPRPACIKGVGWNIEGLVNYFVASKENDPVVLWLPSGLLDNISVLQPSPYAPRAINMLFSLSRRQNILKNSVSKSCPVGWWGQDSSKP